VSRSTWIARFVDGSEQRFGNDAGPLRRWALRLSLLTEAEAVAVREFVTNTSGAFENFTFVDPWDGASYANCSLETDVNEVEWSGEDMARTTLIIRENRS
jgi:hypothetical protein